MWAHATGRCNRGQQAPQASPTGARHAQHCPGVDLQATLRDAHAARIARAVGSLVELGQGALDVLGLREQLLVGGHLGKSFDSEARAIAHPLAEGDSARRVRWRRELGRACLEFALLGQQRLAHLVVHGSSVLPPHGELPWEDPGRGMSASPQGR